jgi:hypothetical protein
MELSNVSISDSADTLPPGDEHSARLAAALAWRFDVGVNHIAHSPAALPSLPADFQPGNPSETFQSFMPALIAALDAAADLLTGNTSYLEGLAAISGLGVRDRDITPIHAVDSMRDDLDKAFEFKPQPKRRRLDLVRRACVFRSVCAKQCGASLTLAARALSW